MTSARKVAFIASLVCASTIANGVAISAGAQSPAPAALVVESPAYKNGEAIPALYGADGRGISPPLTWKGAPASTKEFTVILEDLDNGLIHWTLYKIPASVTSLPEGIPAGGTLGASAGALAGVLQGPAAAGGGRRGGGGGAPPAGAPPAAAPEPTFRAPAPPPGAPHHYRFTVYALDAALTAMPGMSKPALVQAMTGHIVAQGELVGSYQRKAP